MGNREALLAGAKQCLADKGFARTTARDIASTSGVSLAAIGYHFGSTTALLNTALIEAMRDWGDALGGALTGPVGVADDPSARFEAVWTRAVEAFERHRPLLVAGIEALAQVDRSEEVRASLVDALRQGREGLAELFGILEDDPRRPVGSFLQALMTGVITQWIVDPASAPSGAEMAQALHRLGTAAAPDRDPTPS
ncbi:MAG: TetR/AcrR family transcriptional regulator [Pseudonocardia sp.]|nr:TetR/AcrR family transcriptional regulator [Pseudonocardia sp.]